MSKKNPELPGLEGPSIPQIEQAAEDYLKALDKRKAAKEREDECASSLVTTLERHKDKLLPDADGNRVYRFDGRLVTLKEGEATAKVKVIAEDDEDED